MSQGGYFLIIRDFKRQVRFEERIENERYFTDTVTLDMWHGSSREIALISLDGSSIGTICLVERRQKVATYKTLLRFSNFFNLEVPVPFEAIQAHMDNRVRRYFEQLAASSEGGWITPATWDDVIRVISDLRPETNSALVVRQRCFVGQNKAVFGNASPTNSVRWTTRATRYSTRWVSRRLRQCSR